jgi:sugar phosphate isomerase/epimerase
MFRNLNLEGLGVSGRQSELIEWTLSYGFKGFDLDLREFGRQVETAGLERTQRLISGARLRFGSFVLPVNWQGDEDTFKSDLAALPQQAELAVSLGCLRATTMIEPAGDIRPYHENFELGRRRCAEIAAVLSPMNIRLGLAFIAPSAARRDRAFQFIHTADALTTLARTTGAKNVGIVLDVWQWHVAGGTLQQIQALTAQDVVAVNISDATTMAGDDSAAESTRVLPGENGTIDATAILTHLATIGYDGPITPNPHPSRFTGMKREDIVKLSSQAMDKVWQAAGLSKTGKLGVGV